MSETKHFSSINQPDVRKTQEHIRDDMDIKRSFVDNKNASSSDESDDSLIKRDNVCLSFQPTRKKRHSMDYLLHELVAQQKLFMSSQRKVMKLKNEIDTEEIKTRYLKLDLNNSQVEVADLTDKLDTCKNKLYISSRENWISRVLILLIVLTNLYYFISQNVDLH